MILACLVVLSVFAIRVHAALMETITQTTTGWCSPAVGPTGGNVTIVCHGVDPKALARLNELLDKKDLELAAKIREAEDWAQKYRALEHRLATEGQNEPLAQLAQTLLTEGKLDEAGALLDQVLATGEKGVEHTAANHFNRAAVHALQFQPQQALPHYEKAYRYRPDNSTYAFYYALTLHKQRSYSKAQTVYQEVLTIQRQLAQANPQAYLPYMAATLNNLALLYSDTQRLSEGEQAYQEALTIYQLLAQANPQAYLPYVATTLYNLGRLKLDQDDLPQAHLLIAEALTIQRVLWKRHTTIYGNNLAQSLAVEIMILQQKKEPVTLICDRLDEMATVAVRENLKRWATERMATICKRAEQ